MSWQIIYLEEVKDDFRRLDGSQRKAVQKNLLKLAVNPLPYTEGAMESLWESATAPACLAF